MILGSEPASRHKCPVVFRCFRQALDHRSTDKALSLLNHVFLNTMFLCSLRSCTIYDGQRIQDILLESWKHHKAQALARTNTWQLKIWEKDRKGWNMSKHEMFCTFLHCVVQMICKVQTPRHSNHSKRCKSYLNNLKFKCFSESHFFVVSTLVQVRPFWTVGT